MFEYDVYRHKYHHDRVKIISPLFHIKESATYGKEDIILKPVTVLISITNNIY